MNRPIVLDTNIVLDVFIFADEAARPLKAQLEDSQVHWLATSRMRSELERVLAYPHIVSRLAFYRLESDSVLAAFDRHAHTVEAPAKARFICRDADDQMFIDLAVHHRCLLLSKDKAVLTMRKRLALLDVEVTHAIAQSSYALGPAELTRC